MLKKFLSNRRGYAMAYTIIVLTFVAMPMLIISSEIVRMMFVEMHLQAAVDGACTAALQSVDIPHFISTGELIIDADTAPGPPREFENTSQIKNRYCPKDQKCRKG